MGQIGVIIVTFNAADVITDCLDSLLTQEGGAPRIIIVDNGSTDQTLSLVRDWSARALPQAGGFQETDRPEGMASRGAQVTLLRGGLNRGFAGGVNLGLRACAACPDLGHFWILNPDSRADPHACRAILAAAARNPNYGLLGGRVCYAEPPHRIQFDGGTVNLWTGVTSNINLGLTTAEARFPSPEVLDFVTGASLVAARRFYEEVGPMREDYFLYYEEVDWAMRRGALPLILAEDFLVFHHAGTAIGSPTLERMASAFSFWFKYRSRMKFIRRFRPVALPLVMAYASAKAVQLLLRGARAQAEALLRATYG
ncbi:MAG: glycosyltransferase family 2 protein, partial [Rhodobacteraceae bacterium]|nr:glycosyltransferase family 2 protein [Paracoccaceae bacterium]